MTCVDVHDAMHLFDRPKDLSPRLSRPVGMWSILNRPCPDKNPDGFFNSAVIAQNQIEKLPGEP
jgi:hypothetical protein